MSRSISPPSRQGKSQANDVLTWLRRTLLGLRSKASAAAMPTALLTFVAPKDGDSSGESKAADAELEHRDWSSFDLLSVSFAFARRISLRHVKRYVTVGHVRELMGEIFHLQTAFVGLHIGSRPLLVNSTTLEDALEGSTALQMVSGRAQEKSTALLVLRPLAAHPARAA